MGYGVSFHIYKFLNTEDSDNIDDNGHKRSFLDTRIITVGFFTGLLFSIAGRFGLDLPNKMFNMPPNKEKMVHIIAPFLYSVIFVYVSFLMNLK